MSLSEDVVLVVDDDFMILEIVTQQLESFGVTKILTAENAADALQILAGNDQVTVLLTDLSMPGMDGPRFMRELADRKCQARIILISGARNELLQSIGELGKSHGLNMVGYLHKPVLPANLRAMLERRESRPAAPATWSTKAAPEDRPSITRDQLAHALSTRDIHPWYQPKVEADTLRIVGVEALARWRTADGNLISPAVFVPAIEEFGLSNQLFFVMLDQVLAHLRLWHSQGYELRASVNLSMDCTESLSLPDEIAERMALAGIAPEYLTIEITESRLMADRAKSMETITRLSLMGLNLSIDDFGTGYSSLAQLAELPFNELKIDGSFVQRASSDQKATTILQTTILFGRSLAMDVVAEGVEHFNQLEKLRNFVANSIQGYLIARPAPATAYFNWMKQWRPGLISRPGCGRPVSVLIVDDSNSMRALVESTIRERMPDAEIHLATDGNQAFEKASKLPIDFTTIDFHMPGIDGLELLRRLRDLLPAARHCLLTANLDDGVAREAVGLGALYCPKPLTDAQADRIVAHFKRI